MVTNREVRSDKNNGHPKELPPYLTKKKKNLLGFGNQKGERLQITALDWLAS